MIRRKPLGTKPPPEKRGPALGPEVKDNEAKGTVNVDQQVDLVEQALVKLALGYDKKVEKILRGRGVSVRIEVTEHMPPDVKAAATWLRSHLPEIYGGHPASSEEIKRDRATLKFFALQERLDTLRLSKKPLQTNDKDACEDRDARDEEQLNLEVESALVRRAVGYSYIAERPILKRDGTVAVEKLIRHVPPNSEAARIWLRARRPDLYHPSEDSPAELREKVGDAHLKWLEAMNKRQILKQLEASRAKRGSVDQDAPD